MKTYKSGDREFSVPEIVPLELQEEDAAKDSTLPDPLKCVIAEGEFAGTEFTIGNLRMDDEDESLLWYDFHIVKGTFTVEQLKPTINDWIIGLLYDMIEREQNEQVSTDPQCDTDS